MRRINLLPWREQQRRDRKMAFGVGMGAALVSALLFAVGAYLWAGAMVSDQRDRNQRLQTEIVRLDRQIDEINSLEQQKQKFIARMQIIEKLQRSRPEIVHVFDTLVRMIPEGSYLTEVTQLDRRLKIRGVAQSSTRVSAFMRNIDASQWLVNPELEVVETKKENSVGNDFTLYADQASITDSGVVRSSLGTAQGVKP
jgi:type IV pilus assembly protein PilN